MPIDQQIIHSTILELQEQKTSEIVQHIITAIFLYNSLFYCRPLIKIHSKNFYIFHAEEKQENLIELLGFEFDGGSLNVLKKKHFIVQKNSKVILVLLQRIYTNIAQILIEQ